MDDRYAEEQRRMDEASRAVMQSLGRLQHDTAGQPVLAPTPDEQVDYGVPVVEQPPLNPWLVLLDFLLATALTLVLLLPTLLIMISSAGLARDPDALRANLDDLLTTPTFFLIAAGTQAIAFMLIVLLRILWLNRRSWSWLGLGPGALSARAIGWGLLGGTLFLTINVLLNLLSQQLGLQLPDQERIFPLENASLLGLAVIGIAVVILAPVSEELFFRGYAQRVFLERFGPWPGILLGATLFSLPHLLNITQGFLVLLGAVFAGGVVLGWVYWRTGQLSASIIAHAINNSFAFLALVYGPQLESMAK